MIYHTPMHNEITKVYMGFKVYTGTVWADDVTYEEVGDLTGEGVKE